MTIKIEISDEAAARLCEEASRNGVAPDNYAASLLEEALLRPRLAQSLAEVHRRFKASGMSDDELGDFLEDEKHAARSERRAAGCVFDANP